MTVVNYIQHGKFFFTDDTEPAFMDFINRAYENHARVVIEYNEGWEDFSGYHGGNGLKHSMNIGRSTGIKPIPLEISRRDSMGGGGLITCKKAIKRWYIK